MNTRSLPDPQSYRAGLQLMTYLIQDLEIPYSEGHVRVILAEVCARYVPQSLLERIPDGGWGAQQVCDIVAGTPHSGLGDWINYLHHDTNCYFLDLDDEEAGYNPVEWTRENVEELTRQYARAQHIHQEYGRFCDWLEEDMPAHFTEIVDFIERRASE